MSKIAKIPVFVNVETYSEILSQCKRHGECTIEAPGCPIVIVKIEAVGSEKLWSYLWGGDKDGDVNAETTP